MTTTAARRLADTPPLRYGVPASRTRRPPSPPFPFSFFLKNARVFFKSVMEKRGEGDFLSQHQFDFLNCIIHNYHRFQNLKRDISSRVQQQFFAFEPRRLSPSITHNI